MGTVDESLRQMLFVSPRQPDVATAKARAPHPAVTREVKRGGARGAAARTPNVGPDLVGRRRTNCRRVSGVTISVAAAAATPVIVVHLQETADSRAQKIRWVGFQEDGITTHEQRIGYSSRRSTSHDQERPAWQRSCRATHLYTVAIRQIQVRDDNGWIRFNQPANGFLSGSRD